MLLTLGLLVKHLSFILCLFMYLPVLQLLTCIAIRNSHVIGCDPWPGHKTPSCSYSYNDKKSLCFFGFFFCPRGKMWNKAADIENLQYGLAQARRILLLSFAKVFTINKVPLHGELTSIVSGLKIFCETMKQLTKGEKNILGY